MRLCCCFIQNLYLQSMCFLFCRVDSIMLVEEGFNMVSVDASDKMLKYALKSRWERRKEQAFDQWGMAVFTLLRSNCHVWMFKTLRSCINHRLFWIKFLHLCFLFPFLSSVIEEANWLTLSEDIQKPGDGFDAVICLGNSFAHLPDFKGTWEINGQCIFPMSSFILFLNIKPPR